MDTTVLHETARTEGKRGNIATAAMGLGGVLAMVGSLLTWASVSLAGPLARAQGPMARTRRMGRGASLGVSGLDTTAGRAVLALSIALIVVAALAFLAYWFWLRLGAVVVGLVLSAIALVWSALDLASPSSAFGLIGLRLDRRSFPVSAGPGVYLAVVGSALAVAVAAGWLVANREGWASVATVRSEPASPLGPGSSQEEQPTTPLPPATSPGLAPD